MRNLTLTILAATVFSSFSFAGPVNIAIIYASPYESNVLSQLNGTGDFNITEINGATTTPTVAQLENYSAVLVYSDNGFADTTALGNNLDTYLNAGGGVVMAVFGLTDPGSSIGIGGAFVNDLGITQEEQSSGTDLTLGNVNVPGSPLLNGVTSFDGGSSSYNDPGTLVAGFTDVADWSNGTPLVVTGNVGNGITVDLNFYPPSSNSRGDFWNSSTDGTQLLTNALLYSAGDLASTAPEPGSIFLVGSVLAVGIALRKSLSRTVSAK